MTERTDTAPAAFVALIDNGHVICAYGMGATRQQALAAGMSQWAGATASMRLHARARMFTRPLDADAASEHAEMFDAPWL